MGRIVAFGEIMLRLTPENKKLISGAESFGAFYGGSESNVLVALAGFGDETEYVTMLPDNELGTAAIRHLKGYGVGCNHIVKNGNTLGMYFYEEGFGGRNANVIYNRSNSEVTKMTEKDCDFDEIFRDCSIFHISGISFAISKCAKDLSFRLMEEAKKRDVLISFDFNYRGKLWSVEEAGEVYREIMKYVDILFCSEKDLNAFLNTTEEEFLKENSLKYYIRRERDTLENGDRIAWAKLCKCNGIPYEVAKRRDVVFPVQEKIGGGDAFAAGVLHGIHCEEMNLQEILDFGLGCFALKHTIGGDVFSADEESVKKFAEDLLSKEKKSKDVNR